MALVLLAGLPEYDPFGPRTGYALRATVLGALAVAVAGLGWTARRGRAGGGAGADLLPAVLGGVAGLTVVSVLNGTPYGLGGLSGDQTFRTAAVTRFADSARNADFTFPELPSFYAPAYFWVSGRLADLAGVEPWRTAKLGMVLAAVLLPVVTYLLWRRLVPAHTAAVVAAVPLAVANVYEPYAWLVLFAIVPWWLEVVAGVRRAGRAPGNALFLGLLGTALFLTYYYFFFVAALALALYLLVEAVQRRWRWARVRRIAVVLGIAAAGAAVHWLPLLVSLVRADRVASLANRWFAAGHGDPPLPMTDASLAGAVALVGLGYLVWRAPREPLARGLLVLLVAGYAWYLLGAAAAAVDSPLLSFRGKPVVPAVLLTAGVLAAVRVTRTLAARVGPADAGRVVAVALAVLLVASVAVGQRFVDELRDSPLAQAAHAAALPDGALPAHHPPQATVPDPPATTLRATVDALHAGPGHPVLLSDRADLLALYPYAGFLQWNAHYAHPAADFPGRAEVVAGLARLARSGSPERLAAAARDTEFGGIDGFVLRREGDDAVLRYAGDDFPGGLRTVEVRFPRAAFASPAFTTREVGDYLVASPQR